MTNINSKNIGKRNFRKVFVAKKINLELAFSSEDAIVFLMQRHLLNS